MYLSALGSIVIIISQIIAVASLESEAAPLRATINALIVKVGLGQPSPQGIRVEEA